MSADTLYVFAYGSNLSTARVANRIGGVDVVGAGTLREHELRFHKRSKDGSAKADAFYTGRPADCVLGAVYAMPGDAKRKLDEFEGLGTQYLEIEIAIEMTTGSTIAATVYRARPDRIDIQGIPYDWYREHVLVGAREHGLPESYVENIASIRTVRDPDEDRRRREFAISVSRSGLS